MSTQDTNTETGERRRMIDTEWHRDWNRWVVSAQLDNSWTLVGLFEDPVTAFDAARLAARQLAVPMGGSGSGGVNDATIG